MTARFCGAIAVASLFFACGRGPEPCVSATACGRGYECLANRCTPRGGDPVRTDATRVVLEPTSIAAVAATPAAPLGGHVTFGSAGDGAAALYLSFPPAWSSWRRIESAFLLLQPSPATRAGPEDVSVVAWRIREEWAPETVSWRDQPDVSHPTARGIARVAPPVTLRIDVTDIVRHAQREPRGHRGIAVKASAGDGHGATFATGTTSGGGPRLELYVHAPVEGHP